MKHDSTNAQLALVAAAAGVGGCIYRFVGGATALEFLWCFLSVFGLTLAVGLLWRRYARAKVRRTETIDG